MDYARKCRVCRDVLTSSDKYESKSLCNMCASRQIEIARENGRFDYLKSTFGLDS